MDKDTNEAIECLGRQIEFMNSRIERLWDVIENMMVQIDSLKESMRGELDCLREDRNAAVNELEQQLDDLQVSMRGIEKQAHFHYDVDMAQEDADESVWTVWTTIGQDRVNSDNVYKPKLSEPWVDNYPPGP